MRDCAELIKTLRYCNEYDNCGSRCPRFESNGDGDCVDGLMKGAADAIEELLAELVTTRNQLPKWVSVEELLPSRYETVLLNIQTCKDSYVTIGDYEPNELRFRDFADRNNQVYCGDIVTNWMPLPAPPKEVE